MSTPMTISILLENLNNGTVSFAYRKTNGEIRKATGTLKTDLIPEKSRAVNPQTVTPTSPSISYYDTISNGWRAFRPTAIV